MHKPERTTNAFGHVIPEISEIVQDPMARLVIASLQRRIFTSLHVPKASIEMAVNELLHLGETITETANYERQAHELLKSLGIIDRIGAALRYRAHLIDSQIAPYIADGNIIDVGSGDGGVADFMKRRGHLVQCVDVYRHENIDKLGLPFECIEQDGALPFSDESFSNATILTVLHHAQNPLALINEVCRVLQPNGKALVIESVYGIKRRDFPAHMINSVAAKCFARLSGEKQRLANIYFDHLYNRVIHFSEDPEMKVSVPFNFLSPLEWKTVFENASFTQEEVVMLGIDQSVVPEFHSLHVLRKAA